MYFLDVGDREENVIGCIVIARGWKREGGQRAREVGGGRWTVKVSTLWMACCL